MLYDWDDPPISTLRELECNGICLTGYDVGVPFGGIAYAHPDCELHGWGEERINQNFYDMPPFPTDEQEVLDH